MSLLEKSSIHEEDNNQKLKPFNLTFRPGQPCASTCGKTS